MVPKYDFLAADTKEKWKVKCMCEVVERLDDCTRLMLIRNDTHQKKCVKNIWKYETEVDWKFAQRSTVPCWSTVNFRFNELGYNEILKKIYSSYHATQ